MLINVFYEDPSDCDLVEIGDHSPQEIEKLQASFFKWLFDENNDHEYWEYRDGRKFGCAYDAQAFIKWLNDTRLEPSARMIKQHTLMDEHYYTICF